MSPDPTPQRPAEDPPANEPRRRFLSRLTLALSALVAAVAAAPWIGFLLSPVRREDPDVWRAVGTVDDFPLGATIEVTYLDTDPLPWAGFVAENAAWVRRVGAAEFTAFSVYCTHVGCPVRWVEGAQMFMCPCHGGAFHRDGTVAAGPPPRPLPRHEVRLRNGVVEIQAKRIPVPD